MLICLDSNLLLVIQHLNDDMAKKFRDELWTVVISWRLFRLLCRDQWFQSALINPEKYQKERSGFLTRLNKHVRNGKRPCVSQGQKTLALDCVD